MMITPDIIRQHNLTPDEYKKILQSLGREPNLVELGIFSVMWSEHCSYKSSRLHLKKLPTTGPCVVVGPGENAGIVDIGDGQCVVFKMESHNHPSFIEPYQGAATGVGGILRDVFTMGARPIANLNSLRFGSPAHSKTSYLVGGVVAGIAGYGNCMGIPTVGGEVFFDECYNGNILVNAMTVGQVSQEKIFKGSASGPGNPVFYVGSKTGRDGIHGATMASDAFDDATETKKPTVQVGDPFTEKRLLEACLELMKEDAIIGIQDMGAAGLTSSSVEMASRAGTGIDLWLDKIPLREEGMTPYEIMLSESQERMLIVCQKGKEEIAKKIFEKWDLDVCVVGKVTQTGRIVGRWKEEEAFNLPVTPLTDEAPVYDRPRKKREILPSPLMGEGWGEGGPRNMGEIFQKIISHPNQASKKWVYRQYDHQVGTNTLILPGSDAAVVRIKGTKKALALTTNCNSRYCFLDPRSGATIAVAESGRNLVCAGASPLALTDCLNFGNPENPEIMWQFEQSVIGISEACRAFAIPVVSGNVSFYNETNGESIYPTPIIGMVGLLDDAEKKLDQFFKKEGDLIFLLGETKPEIGGSEYLKIIHGQTAGRPPALDFGKEKNLWQALWKMNEKGLIASAHDLSEGGLAVGLAESCLGPLPFGASLRISSPSCRPDFFLFSETQSRVIVSTNPTSRQAVEEIARQCDLACQMIGSVAKERFSVISEKGERWLDFSINKVREWWEKGFEKCVAL